MTIPIYQFFKILKRAWFKTFTPTKVLKSGKKPPFLQGLDSSSPIFLNHAFLL